MDEKQVLSVIKEYVENRMIKQGLMITGEWGCGKTYFVKNTVEKYLKDNNILNDKCYVVLSLYGISDLEELECNIYDVIFSEQCLGASVIGDKFTTIVDRVIKATSSSIDTSFSGIPFNINLGELVKKRDFIQLDKCVIVLDDIERCNLETTELWGFVNSLAENKGIPVIVVANENKITDDSSKGKKYLCEKEKAIYCTVTFNCIISDIFDKLLEQYKYVNTQIVKYISGKKDVILYEINQYHPNNIRTLKFVLDIVIHLIESIYKIENKSVEQHHELYNRFFYYILLRAVQYKACPKFDVDWQNNNYGFIYKLGNNEIDSKNLIWGFRFVDIYINNLYLDMSLLEESYKNEMKIYRGDSLAFDRLAEWYRYCDQEVCEYLDKLKEELINGEYDNSMLKSILWRISTIKGLTNLKYDFSGLIKNIGEIFKSNNIITKEILLNVNKDDSIYDTYNELVTPLLDIVDINYNQSLESLKLFDLLSNPSMDYLDLLNKVKNNLNDYYNAKAFAKFLGTSDELNEYFANSSEANIDTFRGIIRFIYLNYGNNNQLLNDDKEYLTLILSIVKNKIETGGYGKIMKFNLDCLQHDLELIIQVLSGKVDL